MSTKIGSWHLRRIRVCKNYNPDVTWDATLYDYAIGSFALLDDGAQVPLDRVDENGDKWQYMPIERVGEDDR